MRRISTALCTMGLLVAAQAASAQQPSSGGTPAAVVTVAPVAIAASEAQNDVSLRATVRDLTQQIGRTLGADAAVQVVIPTGGREMAPPPNVPVYRVEGVLERAGREQLVLSWRLVGPGDQELMTGRELVVRGNEASAATSVGRTVLKRVHPR